MAACTSTTCAALSSPSTLADAGRPPLRQQPAAGTPHCVSLPPLPPPPPPHVVPHKTMGYCRRIARNVISMATGESVATAPAESIVTTGESTAVVGTELPEIVKTVQDAWDKLEDKYAVTSLAVAGVVALVGSTGMISAIDRLPLVPGVLELVGIGYTGWFTYRNLIFKPDREALIAKIKKTYGEIIGSSI